MNKFFRYALLGLWLVVSPLFAQAPSQVKKVELKLVGPQSVSESLVRANIRVKEGDNFSRLAVDDDVRNIFALTSVLEQHDLEVVHAENGRAGIEMLLKTPGIDGVLMDIMMPEMDGYETMRAIRKIPEFRTLPIFAVTAKAMKGDRAKCIEAGASDYITKPVDLEQLFSVLRVWLTRGTGLPKLEAPQNAMTGAR